MENHSDREARHALERGCGCVERELRVEVAGDTGRRQARDVDHDAGSLGKSERVEMTLRWAGGHETTTTLTRPVGKLSQLSYYDDIVQRAQQLRCEGKRLQQVADVLNAEGWRPAKRRATFNASMVTSLLASNGDERGTPRPRPLPEKLEANEWTLPALADWLGMPRITLYSWVQHGWVRARKVQSSHPPGVWILWADATELERLAALRTAPRTRWARKPQSA